MSPSITLELPIIIIGAGPGGLTLAQLLRRASIPYLIFDRDAGEASRSQGWALALQWVLKDLRTLEGVLGPIDPISHLHEQGLKGEQVLVNGDKEIMRMDADDSFLRADRKKLREWLGQGLDVKWSQELTKLEEEGEKVICTFKDGEKVEGCAVVGADGARSATRAHLFPASHSLRRLPLDAVFGSLVVPRADVESLCKTYARSVFALQSPAVFLFVSMHYIDEDADEAHWYWAVVNAHSHGEKHPDIETYERKHLSELATKWVSHLKPEYGEIVRKTKPEGCQYMPTFLDVWSPPEEGIPKGRVTLLGDAAHKVTPLGGTGVNHAIQDAFELNDILQSAKSIEAALQEYNKKMVVRGRAAVEKSSHWPIF